MRVFVNNVDGFLAGAVCADISALDDCYIIGTQKGCNVSLIPPVVQKLVPRIEVRDLLKTVASCDVVVYDLHDADFEELEIVLRTLRISDLSHNMVFILISSVGVWSRTQREFELLPEIDTTDAAETPAVDAKPSEQGTEQPESSNETAPLRRPVKFQSEDYTRRLCPPKFLEWRTIESYVLALKSKGTIRPYVTCAGIPYGNGEDAFFGLFKAAWETRDALRVIGDGRNYIPTVHARDVARLVRCLIIKMPELDYHLAVDRGDVTQRQLIEAVARQFGVSYDIESVNVLEAVLAEFADMLTMNLRLEPSSLMESPKDEEVRSSDDNKQQGDFDRQNSAGDTEEQASNADPNAVDMVEQPRPAFRWWCEAGLVENMERIAREFCLWRSLRHVRICIVGPPGSCADELAAGLASRFHVPLLSCETLIEEQKNKETTLGKQLRDKMDEIQTALGNPKSNGPFLLPASLTSQVVEASLAQRSIAYRGYVLSGFPNTAEEFGFNFMEDAPPPEEGAEVNEEPPPVEVAPPPPAKGKKAPAEDPPPPKASGPKVPRLSVAPDIVVAVSASDEACLTRLQAATRPVGEREFQLKSDRWKKENPDGGTGLHGLFQAKFDCEVIHSEEVSLPEEVSCEVARIAEALEAVCPVVNFLPPVPKPVDTSEAERAASMAAAKSLEEAARAEAELAKKKKEEDRIEQIKREEAALLERHSEPLRRYMTSFVVPTLTTGLIEICRRQPDDPVGYLAEYLSIYAELARRQRKQKAAAAAAAARVSRGPSLEQLPASS